MKREGRASPRTVLCRHRLGCCGPAQLSLAWTAQHTCMRTVQGMWQGPPIPMNADTNAKSRKRRRLLHMEERTDSLLQGVQKFRNFAKLKLVETPKPLYH